MSIIDGFQLGPKPDIIMWAWEQGHHRHRHIRSLFVINTLVTIPLLFAIVTHGIPASSITPPAQIPTPTPTTTTTPTPTTYTVTKISSTTLTTVSPVLHISPHILSLITTMTVTTYEPWPAFTFPSVQNDVDSPNRNWSTTVLEEVVSSVTWVERRRYLDMGDVGDMETMAEGEEKENRGKEEEGEVSGKGDGKEEGGKAEGGKEDETTITSFVVTIENTWVVHPAGPTGIFLATGVGVGCGGCSLPARPAEPTGSGSRLGRASAETAKRAKAGEQRNPRAQGQGAVPRDKPKGQSGADKTWTEAEVTVVEDPICKSTDLTTGCQGQCIWKPAIYLNTNDTSPSSDISPNTSSTSKGTGTYWCLHIHPYNYADPSLRMGRACWGPYLRYRQLNAPCLVEDVGMACLPCVKGGEGEPGKKDESWDAVFWEGEE